MASTTQTTELPTDVTTPNISTPAETSLRIVAQFLVSITNIQYSLFKSNVIRTVII